jgi:acyl-CoA synthetase (AMP-forming)/AMP-acid ligase II
MTPGDQVRAGRGDAIAVEMADSGVTVTYRELDRRSMQLARRWHAHGLRPGGHVAVLLENHPRWFEVFWASMRSGMYFVPINGDLDIAETAEMLEHADATVLVTSMRLAPVARSLGARRTAGVTLRLLMDGELAGFTSYEDAIASHPARPLGDEQQGEVMFYSSGTTGRPKALEPPLTGAGYGERPNALAALLQVQWGFGPDTVFLTAAPMYHAGPTGFSACVQRLGGTVVLMEEFDAARALELIEQHQVTHALLVPTHFQRLLELDESVRNWHDLSSLRVVIHGTGSCSIAVKERMIDWWGKILHEYYVGAEGNAFTLVTPEDWIEHKGTVGKPLSGAVHVLDDDGVELPTGATGQIWFETGAQFEYHRDPEATRAAFNDRGWSTLGDIGHVDDDGWLYVTDRACNLITSGGATIHPQAIEHRLAVHPAVSDVAVIGDPLRVLVVAADGVGGDEALAAELLDLAGLRATVHFVDSLPRLPTGKLLKRRLQDFRA